MVMSCTKKKEIVKRKRIIAKEKEQEKQDQTYAREGAKTIGKIGLQTKRAENTQSAIDRLGLTSIIMIMDAHIHNIIEPGSYSKRFNETLSKNGIEIIELSIPDSEKLLTHQTIGETIEVMSERSEKLERLEKIGKQLELETETSKEEHKLDSNDEYPEESREAKEYSTKIFALKNKVAKRSPSPRSLKTNYMHGFV